MFFPLLLLLPSDQDDSGASFISHHASVSFGGICQLRRHRVTYATFRLADIMYTPEKVLQRLDDVR
jgi:hypothetical protein